MAKYAIRVKNLSIKYKFFKKLNIKQLILNQKQDSNEIIALSNISFDVKKGETIGIIGKNGSGKSTILKTIAKIFAPNEGSVETYNQRITLLSLGVGFKSHLSGRENIFLTGMLMGYTESEISNKLQEIIDFSELKKFIEDPVKTYSSGMYSRLAFSIGVNLDSEIILIDEILSVGDTFFQKKSFNKIKELVKDRKKTIIIVSHNFETIKELCDKLIWLENGKIKDIGMTKDIIKKYKEER